MLQLFLPPHWRSIETKTTFALIDFHIKGKQQIFLNTFSAEKKKKNLQLWNNFIGSKFRPKCLIVCRVDSQSMSTFFFKLEH